MATNHMDTNPFSTATLTSRLLHSAEGRLRVPRAGGSKASSEGTSMYMYIPPQG